jgi:hypothetical protein
MNGSAFLLLILNGVSLVCSHYHTVTKSSRDWFAFWEVLCLLVVLTATRTSRKQAHLSIQEQESPSSRLHRQHSDVFDVSSFDPVVRLHLVLDLIHHDLQRNHGRF